MSLALFTLGSAAWLSAAGGSTSRSAASQVAIPGLSRLAFGTYAFAGQPTLPRYSYVLLSPSDPDFVDPIKRESPKTKVLAFESASEVMNYDCNCPISYEAARTHDKAHPSDPWLLYSKSGQTLTMPHYDLNHLANVGSTSYRQQWLAGMLKILKTYHWDGVYIDSVLGRISDTKTNPSLYKSDDAWEKAMRNWVAYIGPRLKAQGYYVLINTYKSGPNDGTADIAWWASLAPYVSGLQSEYWEQAADAKTPFTTNPCCWTGHWLNWLKLADAAQRHNADFFTANKGTGTDTKLMSYLRGSYLLVWNGKGGGFSYSHEPIDKVDPWNPAWATYIGKPTGARYQVGRAWRRNYSGGTVIVNPDWAKSQTVKLGGSYRTIDGRTVKSITVKPASAAILSKP